MVEKKIYWLIWDNNVSVFGVYVASSSSSVRPSPNYTYSSIPLEMVVFGVCRVQTVYYADQLVLTLSISRLSFCWVLFDMNALSSVISFCCR